MDLSAFSCDTFDPKEWINATFSCPEAQENMEEYASTLVTKLQSFIQEANNTLEETAQQVIQNVPRVLRDMDSMSQDGELLQEQMSAVKADVIKVEHDSRQSIEKLLKIDTTKARMQEACKALKEADNWSTFSADVEDIFQKGDITAIAEKLMGMQRSLEILIDVPDYDQRCQHLEDLKNRLEAMLSPHLIAAFNGQSVDATRTYAKMFEGIGRLKQLQKYYHNCQKGHLVQLWRQVIEADPEETLIDWLNNFYDALLSFWHSQISWCSLVFLDTSAVSILSNLVVDTLSSFDPSIQFCVEAAVKQQSSPLTFLIQLKEVTDRFAKSLEVTIQGPEGHFQDSHVVALAQALYAHYRSPIEKYSRLEEGHMLEQLAALNMESEEIMDSVHLLGESVSKVISFAIEAENRCQQLTHGCGYPGLLRAQQELFNAYIRKYRSAISQIQEASKQRDQSHDLTEDWVLFQHSLHLMQIIGEAVLQIEHLEQMELKAILKYIKNHDSSGTTDGQRKASSPFQSYADLLLPTGMKTQLHNLLNKIQSDVEPQLFPTTHKKAKDLCKDSGKLLFNIVFSQIEAHLAEIPTMKVWTSEEMEGMLASELPTFSVSPQEYITQIGQYLMMLPQHVEPFVLQDNPALSIALKNGLLPYSPGHESIDQVADYLLGCIARGTVEVYTDQVLQIKHLTAHARIQLITDLGYLCDVLDDLGLSPSNNLQAIVTLLKAGDDDFTIYAQGKPVRLVTSIREMRGLAIS